MSDTATPAPTDSTASSVVDPISKCGACGQSDDHPKHQVLVGYNNEHTEGQMFHPHDFTRDGMVYYHFDCDTPFHAMSAHVRKHQALIDQGFHGAELRAKILEATKAADAAEVAG
jgi:hypothetical protein